MSNTLSRVFIGELERESFSTVKVLSRVPLDKLDWRPHPKSTTLGALAWHVANIPRRVSSLLSAGSFDVRKAKPASAAEHTDFVAELHSAIEAAKQVLEALDDDAMKAKTFRFTRDDETIVELSLLGAIRTIMLNHGYHHRGQLTVYLRLLDIPVPAIYGSSADENPFG
jgi:uncharacterized damage-inducible protein DinB